MEIRNGKFLDEYSQPISEFYDLVNDYEKRLKYAADNTSLPEKPNIKAIDDFLMSVNERIVKNTI
jgi:hypothetical protein